MSNRDLGASGFNNGSLYDSARPDYPSDALDYFVATFHLNETTRALDLGAGTGIFTRQLLPFVGTLTAVDPSASMRQVLASSTPGVQVLEGSDVDIPLVDESVEVVFVAQAFHWFDAPRALAEIRRVLTPNGGLGLIWNERDESVGWVDALSRAMEWDVKQPYEVGFDFTGVLTGGGFRDVERVTLSHSQVLTREGIRQRVLTTSYIATMAEGERAALMEGVDEVINQLDEPITLPYVTSAYSARAID